MSETSMDWRAFLDAYGYYAVSFDLDGKDEPSMPELKQWMATDSPRYTGWPPFWWPARAEIAPQVVDQRTYECLHDGTGRVGHIERWRASTTGAFTLIRAHDTDRDYEPGKFFELVLPAWRVGEILLYTGRMAQRFSAQTVDLTLRYEGLAGRVLTTRASPNRFLSGDYTTKVERYERRVSLVAADIESGVIDMTDSLIRGLFELFQFSIPAQLCEQELSRMRSGRY